jgi:hypothetical protein
MYISIKIEQERAEKLLAEKNGIWPGRKRIIKVELIYLPLFIFTIRLEDKKGRQFHG